MLENFFSKRGVWIAHLPKIEREGVRFGGGCPNTAGSEAGIAVYDGNAQIISQPVYGEGRRSFPGTKDVQGGTFLILGFHRLGVARGWWITGVMVTPEADEAFVCRVCEKLYKEGPNTAQEMVNEEKQKREKESSKEKRNREIRKRGKGWKFFV